MIYELDLKILKIFLHTKSELSTSVLLSKVTALQTDRQTDTHTDRCNWTHYHVAFALKPIVNRNQQTPDHTGHFVFSVFTWLSCEIIKIYRSGFFTVLDWIHTGRGSLF